MQQGHAAQRKQRSFLQQHPLHVSSDSAGFVDLFKAKIALYNRITMKVITPTQHFPPKSQ
eukprot:2764895-Amphidinium_carterae.1